MVFYYTIREETESTVMLDEGSKIHVWTISFSNVLRLRNALLWHSTNTYSKSLAQKNNKLPHHEELNTKEMLNTNQPAKESYH